MKIIDLLNKIANGEEVPKIKYDKHILKYNKDEKRFIDENRLNSLYEIDFSELNDEVEILEEEKKIPEKLDLTFEDKFIIKYLKSGAINYLPMIEAIKQLYDKQCEIIDYLKSKGDE